MTNDLFLVPFSYTVSRDEFTSVFVRRDPTPVNPFPLMLYLQSLCLCEK